MTQETVGKLEKAFLMGLSDREASLFADIHPSTLYKYCDEHPSFSERKELLKEQVKVRAKQNIAAGINEGDKSLSQWYLERKARDEFATKSETAHSGSVAINHLSDIPDDELQRLAAAGDGGVSEA